MEETRPGGTPEFPTPPLIFNFIRVIRANPWRTIFLDIQILYIQRVLFNKLPARLPILAHQRAWKTLAVQAPAAAPNVLSLNSTWAFSCNAERISNRFLA